MNNEPAESPQARDAGVRVATISSPTPTAPQVVIHRTPGCCVPVGASTEGILVHWISFVVLIAHLVTLFFWVSPLDGWNDPWGNLDEIGLVGYLIGIATSTVVLCATSKLSHRICSALYAGVGILDTIVLSKGQYREGSIAIVVVALDIIGIIFCFAGSIGAFMATRNCNTNRSGDPDRPPTSVARTHGCCFPVGANADVMMVGVCFLTLEMLAMVQVRMYSFIILVTHIIALLVWSATIVWSFDPWYALDEFAITYLVGIISSTVVLCVTSKLMYGIGSVLYAGVGIREIMSLCSRYYRWTTPTLLVISPHMFSFFSCLAGSIGACKSTCNWGRNRSGVPGGPPCLVAGIHGCCRVGESVDVAMVRFASLFVLVTHGIALIVWTATVARYDLWGTMDVVEVVAYLLGIIMSIVVLCVTSMLSYGIASVVYAWVGIIETIFMFNGPTLFPGIGATIAVVFAKDFFSWVIFLAPIMTLKAVCKWDVACNRDW